MKARSCKEKGRRFEQHILEDCRTGIDDKAYPIKGSGAGIDKNDIRLPSFDIEIECKNAKQISLVKDFEQLERQLTGSNKGILLIRNPKKPEFDQTYGVVEWEWLKELIKSQKNEIKVEKNFDQKDKWIIQATIENLKKCLKIFQ